MKYIIYVLSIFVTVCFALPSGENFPIGGPAGTCPSKDDEKPVYLLDLKNKYAFYECANGNPYLQYCTAGLIFNPMKDICDYINKECDPFGPVGNCPITNPKIPIFLRDGLTTKVFYICENGKPRMLRCGGELIFNPYKESCVLEIN